MVAGSGSSSECVLWKQGEFFMKFCASDHTRPWCCSRGGWAAFIFGILCVTGDLPACSVLPGGRGRPLARPAVGSTRGRPACRLETQSSRAPPTSSCRGTGTGYSQKPLAIHAPIETRMRRPFPFPYTENTENADTMMCEPACTFCDYGGAMVPANKMLRHRMVRIN